MSIIKAFKRKVVLLRFNQLIKDDYNVFKQMGGDTAINQAGNRVRRMLREDPTNQELIKLAQDLTHVQLITTAIHEIDFKHA